MLDDRSELQTLAEKLGVPFYVVDSYPSSHRQLLDFYHIPGVVVFSRECFDRLLEIVLLGAPGEWSRLIVLVFFGTLGNKGVARLLQYRHLEDKLLHQKACLSLLLAGGGHVYVEGIHGACVPVVMGQVLDEITSSTGGTGLSAKISRVLGGREHRYLFDVFLYAHQKRDGFNTGIQRVISSLIDNIDDDLTIIPCYYSEILEAYTYCFLGDGGFVIFSDMAISLGSADRYVLLDFRSDIFTDAAFQQLVKANIPRYAVLYDSLPATYGERFFDRSVVDIYGAYLDRLLSQFNGLFCISGKVAKDISLVARRIADSPELLAIEPFRLGRTKLNSGSGVVRSELGAAIGARKHVVVMVGTVERRKGYQLFADVASRVLATREDCVFCAVGRPGNDESAKQRLAAMRSDRFFWFEDLSDAELTFLYEKSDVFLYTTFDEGYGLPVVEAAEKGGRLLLPRIPVFEEICGVSACYFDSRDPDAIVNLLGRLLSGEEKVGKFDPSGIPEWSESVRELIAKIEARNSV